MTSPIVVGDYEVSASTTAQEGPVLSNSQSTSLSVRRRSMNSAAPLEIWLSATTYNLPVAAGLNFSTTFAATTSGGAVR